MLSAVDHNRYYRRNGLPGNGFGTSYLTELPDYDYSIIGHNVDDRFTVSNPLGIIAAMNMWTSHDWTVIAIGAVTVLIQGTRGRLWRARSAGAVVTGIAFLGFGLTCIAVGSDYELRWGQPLLATVAIATAAFIMAAGYASPWLLTMLQRRAGRMLDS